MNRAFFKKVLKKKPSEGFAILEGLIAIAVFSIGVLAVCSMQTTSVRSNDIARGITEQSALAAGLVEQLIILPYDHAKLVAGSYPQPNHERYAISYSVLDDDIIVGTKTITVTVTWNRQGGGQKNINLVYIKPFMS